MTQTKKQPQPKFYVNNEPFRTEKDALTEVATLKTAQHQTIVFIDVKAKIQTTYNLNRNNYIVNASVYTPPTHTDNTTNSSNNRDNASGVQNVQQTT